MKADSALCLHIRPAGTGCFLDDITAGNWRQTANVAGRKGSEKGVLGGLAGALRARERAVMLTAVQSLRLLVRKGLFGERRFGRGGAFGLQVRLGVLLTR
jgi:hypothetical protein